MTLGFLGLKSLVVGALSVSPVEQRSDATNLAVARYFSNSNHSGLPCLLLFSVESPICVIFAPTKTGNAAWLVEFGPLPAPFSMKSPQDLICNTAVYPCSPDPD